MSRLFSVRALVPAFVAALLTASTPADEQDTLKVGVQPDGRILVPTNQILSPAGKHLTFPGRPVDLALTDGGKVLVIKNMRDLVFVDLETQTLKQTLPLVFKKGETKTGLGPIGLVVHKDKVYAGDARDQIRVASRQEDGKFQWDAQRLELNKPEAKGLAYPAGLAQVGEDLWVAASRGNTVQRLDLASGKVVEEVPVGVAPFAVVAPSPDKLYVSNWGGDAPKADDPKGVTSGTDVRVDPRTTVANQGTLSVLTRTDGNWKWVRSIEVGLRPGGMTLSRSAHRLFVANASSDSVSVIDTSTDKVIETILCRAEARLPFGSGCNAVALSPDGGTLYVANGTNNCIAVVRLGSAATEAGDKDPSRLLGLIPTGWFPGAVLVSADGKTLYVANVKGVGSLSEPRPKERGKNSHDHLGSLSIIPVPDEKQLAVCTAQVNANNRVAHSLTGLDKPRPDVKPVPVPQRHGEPSVFKHVLYVIKENRAYDQILGDVKEGNGDPNLVLFGEDVTPNHHKLVREFTLFDNFYCSGVLSADGHTWVTEAYVGDYLEKAFGGFTRSYPDDGSDHLAYSPTGFLWDNALLHKRTIRNFGEYVTNTFEPKTARWKDFYDDYKNGTNKVKASAKANVKALEPYTHPGYPWFPLYMPDVYRTRLFLEDLKGWEGKGDMPNLIFVTLPCDHTDGTRPETPTPRAMVADNDLALGQLVEGVTRSRFWADTIIFVVEDDPQNGFDHVDGHRTVAMAISPYTKRKFVDSTCYNQTGMVKTIELVLGLPPMTQLDLSATPMRNCFTDKPDLTPYTAVPNRIPLDEMNKPLEQLRGMALHWARKSLEMNLDDGDAADEDTLNRILWFAMHGEKPYPVAFAGRKEEDDDDD
jgi:YVTN family beta-propeller protein